MKKGNKNDPKGLIGEAYKIEGITAGECRSIFLDWALGVPIEKDIKAIIKELLSAYELDAPEHPMTGTLCEGLKTLSSPRRRGGWRGRQRSSIQTN